MFLHIFPQGSVSRPLQFLLSAGFACGPYRVIFHAASLSVSMFINPLTPSLTLDQNNVQLFQAINPWDTGKVPFNLP